jgi:hypothetical protein
VQSAAFEYTPRRPEQSVLYQVVAEQLETFLARQQARDRPVPHFVDQAFRSFLIAGFWRAVFCAFGAGPADTTGSCRFHVKGGFGIRLVVEDAWQTSRPILVERVFPIVPVRQWVLSLPFALRYPMAYDARLAGDVLNVFIRALFGELRRRAQEQLGVSSSQCGAVTFVQRHGDALNCHERMRMQARQGAAIKCHERMRMQGRQGAAIK